MNLETALTRSEAAWPGKGIHYRTSPENGRVLTAAGIDCCALANNHVLDWGYAGLEETLRTLDALGVRHAGAGRSLAEAEAPAVMELGEKGRLFVYSFASPSSGIPAGWAASETRPGVALLRDLFTDDRRADRRPHARGEEGRGRGGWGYEQFRADLGLLYFVTLDQTKGGLERLRMTPTRISRFQVHRASGEAVDWLAGTLNREGGRFRTSVERTPDGRLELRWESPPVGESPP